MVYAAALNAPSTLEPDQTAYFGGKVGTMDGDIVAMSARSGKVAWDTKVPGDPTGGVTVVNNLVLTATYQGEVLALNRATGAVVWTLPRAGFGQWMDVRRGCPDLPAGRLAGAVSCPEAPTRSLT